MVRRYAYLVASLCLVGFVGWFALLVIDFCVVPWRTLIYSSFPEIEFSVEIDVPDYCQFTITNDANETAHDVILTVWEDWSYVGEGQRMRTIQVGEMPPGDKRMYTYEYYLPGVEYEVGQLDIYLKCSRGRALDCTRWSWAY